jgi:hypothetical protein
MGLFFLCLFFIRQIRRGIRQIRRGIRQIRRGIRQLAAIFSIIRLYVCLAFKR